MTLPPFKVAVRTRPAFLGFLCPDTAGILFLLLACVAADFLALSGFDYFCYARAAVPVFVNLVFFVAHCESHKILEGQAVCYTKDI